MSNVQYTNRLLRIGSVSAVRGSSIEIVVDADKNEPSLIHQGEIIQNVTVGSFIIIHRGYRRLVAQVQEEFLVENREWPGGKYRRDSEHYRRILKTTLLGTYNDGIFSHGRTLTPLIGNTAYLATTSEKKQIYSNNDSPDNPNDPHKTPNGGDGPPLSISDQSGTRHQQLEIGTLNNDSSVRFSLNISPFFASHIGIFGNTGSGKSYTLTQIYTKLFEIFEQRSAFPKHTHFIIFDLNGEYSFNSNDRVLCDRKFKTVHNISRHEADTLKLPSTTLYDPDFWYTVLEATEKTQQPFIRRTLADMTDLKYSRDNVFAIFQQLLEGANPTQVDHTLIFSFLEDIHQYLDFGNKVFVNELLKFRLALHFNSTTKGYYVLEGSTTYYVGSNKFNQTVSEFFNRAFSNNFETISNPIDKVNTAFRIQFYSDIARGFSNTPHLRPLISRLDSRIPLLKTTLSFVDNWELPDGVTIINLQNASLDMRKLVPLVITRALYREHKSKFQTQHGSTDAICQPCHFLNLIIDEAHNLLSYEPSRESETWRNTRLEMFEEILKEGRKFGVFVTLASQRPYDISSTITSQLHHYLLHQLVNPNDVAAVRNSVAYLDDLAFDELTSLARGTCIISGTSIQVPAIVNIDPLDTDRCPHNETIDLNDHWQL